MKQSPVSVVIPCYNCFITIERAVASLVKQTCKPAQVILVDDASSDGTLDVLYRLQAGYIDGWISVIPIRDNVGPGSARNVGWGFATQPFIAFLDADDTWHPQKLEIQANWMMNHPEAALTGHIIVGEIAIDEPDAVTLDHNSVTFRQVGLIELLSFNRFSTPSVIVRADVSLRFEEGQKYSEDYSLWCRICAAGLGCYEVSGPLAYCYKNNYGASGLSSRLWRMESGELGVYFSLYKDKQISFLIWMRASLWSLLKFSRRLAIVSVRALF